MGSSSSRPTSYPFPMPGYSPVIPSKSRKWTLGSTKKKSKKGKDRERYDDFIFPKHPTTAPPYGMSYYPQSSFPAYYAPVQMAVVQPIGVQQPVLAMPQAYLPIATYPTSAAPIQPPVAPAPAIQHVPPMQMHVPGPATAPAAPAFATTPAMQMPVPGPASIPVTTLAPPTLSAPAQMPQPQPYNQGPVLPSSPIPSQPVIPPNPILEPPLPAPGSARPRFTDFYRPADLPPPRRGSIDEPVRPPTAGPPGRTPYVGPASMPTPSPAPMRMPTPGPSSTSMPVPISNNPLPPPPADVWDTVPYRQVLENLPTDVSTLLDLRQRSDVFDEPPRPSSRLGTRFGTTSRKDKGKGPLRGLFRSRSTSGYDVPCDMGSASGSRHGHSRAQTMTSIVIPPPGNVNAPMDMPVPSQGPPIKFDHTGEYAGFVNHSNHRVMYRNKVYPTALHLLEAMKFMHQPNLQERIRTCNDVNDMYPLSASFQEHVRSDWGHVFLKTMEDVLYLKFKQHPNLRALLLGTGLAEIIYSDDNEYWGEGASGDGTNELGKALVRVRERLRHEGER